jgi:hypothetical protein
MMDHAVRGLFEYMILDWSGLILFLVGTGYTLFRHVIRD